MSLPPGGTDEPAAPGADLLVEDDLDSAGADGPSELRSIIIGTAQHGARLDRALVELVPEFSRSYLQQLLTQGHVQLHGKPALKASARVKAGDQITLEMRPTLQSQAFQARALHAVRSGRGAVLVPPHMGRAAIGIKVDRRNRIFVAGGPTGQGYVYDAGTGAVTAEAMRQGEEE